MRVLIVGAGMAGLACAEGLNHAGHAVTLLDKGRGAGGRMASRRIQTSAGEAVFDHGAQYFTVRDETFAARVERWRSRGHVTPWPEAGPDAWVGTPSMNAPLRQMAEGLDVRWGTRAVTLSRTPGGWIVATEDGGPFDAEAVVLALPAEQAAALTAAAAPQMSGIAAGIVTEPCWTVMMAFSDRLGTPIDCLRTDRPDSPIGWAARNRSKPGRTGPETWVLQAGPVWSRHHIEVSPDQIVAELTADLSASLGLAVPQPIAVSTHRWLYARSGAEGSGALWDADLRIGLCGDWLLGPRVEAAWMSGDALARRVASTIGD